jgi:hypothetical protein
MFDRILAGILPLQLKGDELAFNIRPLDTIMYRKGNFKELVNHSIDEAIIQTGTTVRGSVRMSAVCTFYWPAAA